MLLTKKFLIEAVIRETVTLDSILNDPSWSDEANKESDQMMEDYYAYQNQELWRLVGNYLLNLMLSDSSYLMNWIVAKGLDPRYFKWLNKLLSKFTSKDLTDGIKSINNEKELYEAMISRKINPQDGKQLTSFVDEVVTKGLKELIMKQ